MAASMITNGPVWLIGRQPRSRAGRGLSAGCSADGLPGGCLGRRSRRTPCRPRGQGV